MKKLTVVLLLLALCLGALTGCGDIVIGPAPTSAPAESAPSPQSVLDQPIDAPDSSPKHADITLTGSGASVQGGGVSVSGSTVTISSPGSYSVSGKLDDGCVIVNTGEDKSDVTITLKGADITCLGGPAIHVVRAKNVDLVLADGTENRLVSGSETTQSTAKQDGAVIFSESDLDILGPGSLELLGYINNGITCKDDLDIKDGTITVTAVNNGVKGSESVEIFGGSLSVTAGNDGVKSTSAKKEGKGFIEISGGTVEIRAKGDGIAAETTLTLSGGEIRVTTEGDRNERSCKALKAKTLLTVSGSTVEVDSTDHALHSALDMDLSGGTLTIVSRAGKGLSAHGTLTLSGGTLDVTSADDGIEAEEAVIISGSSIQVLAKGNGIKAGSKDGLGAGTLTVTGGEVMLSAFSDPFETKGGATISGGSFTGVGSPKTPEGFSSDSSQLSLLFAFNGAANTAAEVWSSSNQLIDVIEARCGYTCAIFSRSGLSSGTYTLELGTLKASAEAK